MAAPTLDEKLRHAKHTFAQPDAYLKQFASIELRVRAIQQLLGGWQPKYLLDIGCGDARISLQYLNASNAITLVDYSEGMLDRARDRVPAELLSNVTFVNESLAGFQSSATFDTVFAIGVLSHIPDLEGALRRLYSLLAPGGRCVVQITDDATLGAQFHGRLKQVRNFLMRRESLEVRLITATELKATARSIGFQFLDSKNYWVPLPGMGAFPPALVNRMMLALNQPHLLNATGPEKLLLFTRE